MALPSPIPDNPTRWEGWRDYNSADLYARLCLSYESNPSPEQIEENCRQLLVWWQKKLPLKNQPSNPLAQMLRAGLDEAPVYLAEARTKLLDAEARSAFDHQLHSQIVQVALGEFKKLLVFAIGGNKLREEDETRLYERGRAAGLSRDEMQAAVEQELKRVGAERVAAATFVAPAPPAGHSSSPAHPTPPAPGSAPVAHVHAHAGDPVADFRRMLRLSKLSLDGEEMTDDQRDAMCNMGESLGLSGGQAEDLIDEYLDEVSGLPVQPTPAPAAPRGGTAVATAPPPPRPVVVAAPVAAPPKPAPSPTVSAGKVVVNTSPLARAAERLKYPAYSASSAGIEMLLVTSGAFQMGSTSHEALSQEQPITPVILSCYYMARFPVTNAQYEKFDPTHKMKRAPWADDNHPVVYVNSKEAEKFCAWLTQREGRKYRLPTEAEWEFAARGMDNRTFPWGEKFDAGHYANFADVRTNFAWKDQVIDDGFAETAPVGSFPKGVGPFGMEDLSGNVFEWCLDNFEPYKGKERVNPRGLTGGMKRVYRGGSWKSRIGSLRASARNFNTPEYSSNDVGFRVVCECEE